MPLSTWGRLFEMSCRGGGGGLNLKLPEELTSACFSSFLGDPGAGGLCSEVRVFISSSPLSPDQLRWGVSDVRSHIAHQVSLLKTFQKPINCSQPLAPGFQSDL